MLATGTAWLAVLAVVCLGLTMKDARAQSASVTGPRDLKVSTEEAPVYRAALGAIASHTRPGEAILIAPQLSALYTLSDRSDALRQISLVPGALAKGDERGSDRSLAPVRLRSPTGTRSVSTDRRVWKVVRPAAGPLGSSGTSTMRQR
jgi:hypothetical protein